MKHDRLVTGSENVILGQFKWTLVCSFGLSGEAEDHISSGFGGLNLYHVLYVFASSPPFARVSIQQYNNMQLLSFYIAPNAYGYLATRTGCPCFCLCVLDD